MVTSAVNADGADERSATLRAWRKPAKTATAMCLKMETTFPLWDVQTLWGLTGDVEERFKWDSRAQEPVVLERFPEDNCKIINIKFPKPPVPVVGQREIVTKLFTIENFEEGVHMNLGCSVEHPEKPVGEGYFDYVRAIGYTAALRVSAAASGKGVTLTEIRHIDLNGQFPQMVIDTIASWVPTLNYNGWNEKYQSMI